MYLQNLFRGWYSYYMLCRPEVLNIIFLIFCLCFQPNSSVYILPFLTHEADLRLPSTVPLNFTKSISLSLSERGINSIRASGRPDLLPRIISETLPMRGRMIHGKSASGEFYQQPQDYDVRGRVSYAASNVGILANVSIDELRHQPGRF
jgi:hypothetical protein